MNTQAADQIGMGLSILCAIHCVLTPVFVILYPSLQLLDSQFEFHYLIAPAIVLFGVIAFWRGYRHHMRQTVLLTGFLGLALVAASLILGDGGHQSVFATSLTVIGSLILIGTHWRNIRLCRCQSCQH